MAYRSMLRCGIAAALMVMGASVPAVADQAYGGRTVDGLYLNNLEKLEQGWRDAAAVWYYHTSQGSQMMHYDIFLALEMADSEQMLKDAVVDRFNYLPAASTYWNPDLLPIGFAKDRDGTTSWIGMTCAACHTGRVDHNGHKVLIDGAPSLGDLSGLIAGMSDALKAARTDGVKQARFVERMLGKRPSRTAVVALLKRLDANIAHVNDIVLDSFLTAPGDQKVVWGHGRTDAFGMIFNRVASTDLKFAGNRQPPNAPVSYPHIWDTGRFNWVQWNAVVPNNTVVEKLFRNSGEVLGVFGTATLAKPTSSHNYYNSSLRVTDLLYMEELVETMTAPKWTDLFGGLNADKVARGGEIYGKTCAGCHQLLPAGTGPFEVGLTKVTAVGTDPVMARNALRVVETRQLAGSVMPPRLGTPLASPKDLGVKLLANAVAGSVVGRFADPFQDGVFFALADRGVRLWKAKEAVDGGEISLATDKRRIHDALSAAVRLMGERATPDLSSYKSRPLDGIWATAPFLHNGSVPNLYQLLLPAVQRDKTFKVGSFKYDAKHVGYITDEGGSTYDTTKLGNSNAGHEYGANLSDEDRWALIEYLKSL